MQAPLDTEMRDRLGRYLAGEQPLQAFLEWLLPLSADVDEAGGREAADLANEILLRWAELTNGHWTEAEFKARLQPLLRASDAPAVRPSGQPAA